jgi:hypothetical protein
MMSWSLVIGTIVALFLAICTEIGIMNKASPEDDSKNGSLVFLFTSTVILWYVCGAGLGVEQIRKQAIEAEVAEWKCDPETGKKTFVYKEK